MTQESCAETLTLVSALDDSGNVGHHERLMITHLDNTQVGFKCGEGVVCNLGFCCRNDREQRTLTRIGETHQTYIGQHLQLEDESTLIAILTGLCIAGSLISGALEVPVTQTATATLQ